MFSSDLLEALRHALRAVPHSGFRWHCLRRAAPRVGNGRAGQYHHRHSGNRTGAACIRTGDNRLLGARRQAPSLGGVRRVTMTPPADKSSRGCSAAARLLRSSPAAPQQPGCSAAAGLLPQQPGCSAAARLLCGQPAAPQQPGCSAAARLLRSSRAAAAARLLRSSRAAGWLSTIERVALEHLDRAAASYGVIKIRPWRAGGAGAARGSSAMKAASATATLRRRARLR